MGFEDGFLCLPHELMRLFEIALLRSEKGFVCFTSCVTSLATRPKAIISGEVLVDSVISNPSRLDVEKVLDASSS